jgi:DNA-binding CsgD family transcriptional regulator
MQRNTSTYEQYMDLIADASPERLYKDSKVILDRFCHLQKLKSRFLSTIFFVDYTSRKYIYIDSSCIDVVGYPDTYYYSNGHEGFLKKTNPLDYEIVNSKVFPVNLNYLKGTPPERFADLVFSHNFRMKNQRDEYRVILQRYSYIPGESNSVPIGVIGIASDITHFKTDLSIVHTIEETTWCKSELRNDLVYKEIYPIYDTDILQSLSKRELEVLKYLAEGSSSKQIANRLQLSVNTINNHRKNMLQKINCKSSVELLRYAMKHGLL